jgi:hypothetical protein
LCYRKRIKCDGQFPRCSNCQVYNCQCTHETASRRKKRPNSQRIQPNNPLINTGLNPLNTKSPSSHYGDMSSLTYNLIKPPDLPPEGVTRSSMSTDHSNSDLLLSSSSGFSLDFNFDFSKRESVTSTRMELPAENHVRQLVNSYLENVNSILPLFDPQKLTQTVDRWYRSPLQRSRLSWAVISVVMGIAQHCSFSQVDFAQTDSSLGSVSDCLNKAQSALTEILMGDIEVASLQVVLGVAIIFQGTSDIRPAVFLIPTALRLCQILGLHRGDSDIYSNSTADEALQLRRVFWIAYILDRDIAMRIRQAPIQQDAEISIELPPIKPDEKATGFINAPQMYRYGFNVFRAQIELAQIQGHVYDTVFSVRAQQLIPSERAASCHAIRLLLNDWKARIPETLSAEALSRTQNYLPCISRFLCMLYGTVITCLGQLCQVNSMDFHWIDQLRDYGQRLTVGLVEPCMPPPLPQGWNDLVNECRDFMPLFISMQDKSPAFIW